MKVRRVIGASIALGALVSSSVAEAKWVEVVSTNFRYFSEDKPSKVRERVENLEKLDKIVRAVTANKRPPSPLPVTVFELPTMHDVQETLPGSPGGVAAYYTTSPEGAHLVTFFRPLKVSTSGRIKRTYRIQDEVTQHEYLHHMMFQYFPSNYPAFYPEGFAEYYGTILFEPNNIIVVGHAPVGRLESMGDWLPVEKLLTAKSYADVNNLSGLYAEGWLLTHMAAARPERGKQLAQYLRAVARGMGYKEAAEQAFGDLDQLDKDLRAYKDHVTALTIKLNGIDIGPVSIRKLPDDEEALVPVELALRSAYKKNALDSLAARVRKTADDYPNSAYAVSTLALVEYLAGNPDDALAAARRALAIDPRSARANLVLSEVETDRLAEEKSSDEAAWDAARKHYLVGIAANPTNTRVRLAFYESYAKQGVLAAPVAQNALIQAFDLMPSDDNVRYLVAADFEARGMIGEAIKIIEPSAYGTFSGDERERKKRDRERRKAARKYTNITYRDETAMDMLKRLEAKRDGKWDEATGTIIRDAQGGGSAVDHKTGQSGT